MFVNRFMLPNIQNTLQGIKFYLDPFNNGHKILYRRLLRVFNELFLSSSGNLDMTLNWLKMLDVRYGLFTADYKMSDFLKDLQKMNLIHRDPDRKVQFKPTSKLESEIRKNAFESLFGHLKKGNPGNHITKYKGTGIENTEYLRPYEFGDQFHQINTLESLKNAFLNHGISNIFLEESDLMTHEQLYQTQCSTVLLIDISHSMILYGEDRITPAKKVALALSQMIHNYYPKDKLDFVVFGDDAWQVELGDLIYLEVGPYHTNTVAGLQLAIEILNKRKTDNKHIMMITDGKPSCIKRGKEYYKNSFGLDPLIVSRTLALARKCRKQQIEITTFMVTTDPYLTQFIDQFSKEANGKAFYTNLDGLGENILIDYERTKKKKYKR